ncbi:FKBP-type peptidyl-prolyl cis-trans isomerase [Klebsormidium nitens]|uniref:peptidylprolyl isomerase n=1 Tax=Klebsormidium nitens TaxID=105231 RepID=A0A1Y1HVT2_KLENI|nr:FKBP-type peptidyl-prolyl cis-trans isomerase [Klebsormidium nitens]|eukprot:GAQ81922.1 FKBP-type peptidyl-prolyl cis-trans isomerase [Klebsormidium nitens]
MAVASCSSPLCARLLPSPLCRSASSTSSSFFNGLHIALSPYPRHTAGHRLTIRAASQKASEPSEDLMTKKFQIPGFRLLRKSSNPETTDATSAETSGVSRRQAMVGAVAGALAAAGAGLGASQADADEAGDFVTSPSGLGFKETSEGAGAEPVKGQLIKAHYTGRLESNGKVFDSSYTRGKPLTFRIGAGEVIKGWDQGILGAEGIPAMKAGGKRVLRIPAALGYGARGAGCRGGNCVIPPNSTLIFDVEFLGKASG